MDKKKALGQRLRELRKAKNITQEQLAEIIDVEPTSISNIECGRNYPNFANLEKLLEKLDSSFLEIFDFEHFDNTDILRDKIIEFTKNASNKEIEFLFKTISNLKEFNS
ncbi:helix-turn-helix transcriptional regulator [bacterium]|nr:helix-turn-helix transcriptional regulator [bacterium]